MVIRILKTSRRKKKWEIIVHLLRRPLRQKIKNYL
jgi:hypothetical protein